MLGGVDLASARYRDAASQLRGRVLTDILWLTAAAESMTDAGLFVREADPQGGRRIFIALDEGAHEAMTRYFEALDE